ncbi:hypothetical protein C8J57DRAFT_1499757 [Mycena rebaudengoi]|nr:hypothetical protein C8J57DRAFT_1499757 [Mycena rebaudengoi]
MFATFIALFTCAVSTAHCLVVTTVKRAVTETLVVAVAAAAKLKRDLEAIVTPFPPPTRTTPVLIPDTPSLPGLDGFVNHLGCWMVLAVVGLAAVLVVHGVLIRLQFGSPLSPLVTVIERASSRSAVKAHRLFKARLAATTVFTRAPLQIISSTPLPSLFFVMYDWISCACAATFGCVRDGAASMVARCVRFPSHKFLGTAPGLHSTEYRDFPEPDSVNLSLHQPRRRNSFHQTLPWPGSLRFATNTNLGTSLANTFAWVTLLRTATFKNPPTDLRFVSALGDWRTWEELWLEAGVHEAMEDHPAFPTLHAVFRDRQDYIVVMDCAVATFSHQQLSEEQALFYGAQFLVYTPSTRTASSTWISSPISGYRFPSVSKEYGVWHKLRDAGSDAFPLIWPSHDNPDHTSQICGIPGYASPELRRPCYSYSVDFWALGVVLHEWLVGNFPFADDEFDPNFFALGGGRLLPPGRFLVLVCCAWAHHTQIFAIQWPRRSEDVAELKAHSLFRWCDWERMERRGYRPPGIT